MMNTFMFLTTFILVLPFTVRGQNPITTGEIYDGTPRDIASGNDVLYLAQGRYLALLDPQTGLRIRNHRQEPYEEQLVAVEFDNKTNLLFVATEWHIHIYDENSNKIKIWQNDRVKSISDFKFIEQDQVIVAILSDEVAIIDYAQAEPSTISVFSTPPGILFFNRIHIADTRNGQMAYLTGAIAGQQIRGVNGLIIVKLDSDNGYASPIVYPVFWNPVTHYSSVMASVLNVQVLENYDNQFTYAFSACGNMGQLTVLDVTDPSSVRVVTRKVLAENFGVYNVLLDDDTSRLFVASTNILHALDINTLEVKGSINAGFFDSGDRDMVLYRNGPNKTLWTATHFSVDYVINAVDVTSNQLNHPVRQWWISSSDGAVGVPRWNSVYLPTFGGIVRYDVSDETNPIAVNESYQPAGGTIEHIDIIYPDPQNLDQALLLTAPGNGGVQYWQVSSSNPNPGRPTKVVQKPAQWGNAPVYQNDVGHFRKDGTNYFLADLANRTTHEIALQIYNTSTGQWINVIAKNDQLKSNSHSIAVHGEYAFVTCFGGFFVVDLSSLPLSASITDIVINDWNNDNKPDNVAAIVISPNGNNIFIAHDPGVVQSYAFDKSSGKVSGPLDQLYGENISGSTSRGRYFGALDRLYIAGRGGNIMEIDAKDPYNLRLISVWNNGAYRGEMQDCRIYNFGSGPSFLAVKNNEGFAIVKITGVTAIGPNVTNSLADIHLGQNFPNPLDDETVISWKSVTGGHTILQVYDITGRKVKTLVDNYKHPGSYELNFYSETLPSGVYYYQLQIGNLRTSKKMLIMK
jgi:hypothetical protein